MTYKEWSKGLWDNVKWYHAPAVIFFRLIGIEKLMEHVWDCALANNRKEDENRL